MNKRKVEKSVDITRKSIKLDQRKAPTIAEIEAARKTVEDTFKVIDKRIKATGRILNKLMRACVASRKEG